LICDSFIGLAGAGAFFLFGAFSVGSGNADRSLCGTVFGTSAGFVASPGIAGTVSSSLPAFCCIGVRVSFVTGGGVPAVPGAPADPLVPEPCAHAAPPLSGTANSAMRSSLYMISSTLLRPPQYMQRPRHPAITRQLRPFYAHDILGQVITPPPAHSLPAELAARLANVRLLGLDVDGVLTDGFLYWAGANVWSQRFSVRDGYGIKLLQELGIEVAIFSGGDVRSGRDRCASLGIRHAHFGVVDKVAVFRDVAGSLGLLPAHAAFMGDELVDIPLLQQVGFSATVPDAVDEVKAIVDYVTHRRGGDGAVREVCDLIRTHRPPR
jgi:3-deoxy-D-manno-octulosonate 8-phosphate phosphatase (KDO 8-P phosphatase)